MGASQVRIDGPDGSQIVSCWHRTSSDTWVPSRGDGVMPKATLRRIPEVSQGGAATCVQRGFDHVTIHTWPTHNSLSRSAVVSYIGGCHATNWVCHRLPRDDAHALLIEQAKHQLGCDSLFPLMEMG